ncbi:signal peptidase II [Gordonia sp. PKS22-38]|uniref:Lipoprotein signal peptidase n=1 Tax=Gordonia prachuapensis TaxID=3115651 RepID=A0ABU7MS70_9ACTN|nr:signal peptidase II [Gordonia sp. PKS22-38]
MSEPTSPPVDSGGRSSRHESRRVVRNLLALAAVIIGLDLLTKTLAVAFLDPQDPIEIIGDVVTLTLVRNSGAAFSMASGYTWVLTIVALCVVIGIIRYSNRLRSAWWIVGLGLVLGGAVGNLIDRIFRSPGPLRGHVVDFVSVGWWPVFNVADSAVVCGAVLLVALSLLGFEYDGSRTGWAARRSGGGDADDRPAAEDADA